MMRIRRDNKYGNKKITLNGVTYDSKIEFELLSEFLLREKIGEINSLKLKPRFLIINDTETERAAYYTPECEYIENGKKVAVEIKSKYTAKLPDYVLRRKIFKQRYPEYEFIELIK